MKTQWYSNYDEYNKLTIGHENRSSDRKWEMENGKWEMCGWEMCGWNKLLSYAAYLNNRFHESKTG